MRELPNKRAEKIFESTLPEVADRIEGLASRERYSYQVAFKDCPDNGTLEFFLLDDSFGIVDKQKHDAFLGMLLLEDIVLNESNSKVVAEDGFDPYIKVAPRKNMV